MLTTHTALTTPDSHACGSAGRLEPLIHLEGGTAGVGKSRARWLMGRRHSVGAVGLYHAGFWTRTYTRVHVQSAAVLHGLVARTSYSNFVAQQIGLDASPVELYYDHSISVSSI